jgi:predicted alpha/beta hydrolase
VSAPDVAGRELQLACADGRHLAASVYEPAGAPRLAVQVDPGTAIPRHFYRYFAAWLAAQGCLVLTYDNRGVGGSLHGASSRHDDFRFSDWGAKDQPAASAWLLHHAPEAPLVQIAHSFGAPLAGLSPLLGKVRAMIAVASHYYLYEELTRRQRLAVFVDTRIRMPFSLLRRGYYANRSVGFELPPQATREMARWQRNSHFFTHRGAAHTIPHFGDLRRPLRHYIPADDEMVQRRQANALIRLFPYARGENVVLWAKYLGLETLGHFGFFRKTAPESLWRDALAWLEREARA